MPAVVIANPAEVYQGPNTQVVLDAATVTADGSTVVRGYGVGEIAMFVNIGSAPTGTGPFISFTIVEVDPIDEDTAIGNPSVTSNFSTAVAGIVQRIPFASSGTFKVSWALGGTSPSFTDVSVVIQGKAVPTKLVDANGFSLVPNGALRVINAPNAIRNSRVTITFMAVAPAVADTLLSLVKSKNGVAAAGATSIKASAGYVLRITNVIFGLRAGAAAAANAVLTLRQNPSGATVIGSNIEMRMNLGNTAASIGSALNADVGIEDGLEITGNQSIGISLAAQAVTNVISITLLGYEYFA